MPLFEMPLEQLQNYQGCSPRPDNIDAYWDRAIEEMRAIDPQVCMELADFQVPYAVCYDMTFTGVGGARIYAKIVTPVKAKDKHPAVIKFHGYTCNSGSWTDLLPYAAAGMTIASMDCRGQGGKSEDLGSVKGNTHHGHIIRGLEEGPEKLLFRSIFLDCAELAGIIMAMEDVDENRVGCFGGSQGGALTIACACLEPRIKRIAPQYPFLCDYKRVWNMDLDVAAYQEMRDWFRRFDPNHAREDYFYDTLGYIDLQNIAHRMKAEVLMFTGLMDTICPPSSQFAAYNKITSKKDVVIYPDFTHETLPGCDDKTLQFMLEL